MTKEIIFITLWIISGCINTCLIIRDHRKNNDITIGDILLIAPMSFIFGIIFSLCLLGYYVKDWLNIKNPLCIVVFRKK